MSDIPEPAVVYPSAVCVKNYKGWLVKWVDAVLKDDYDALRSYATALRTLSAQAQGMPEYPELHIRILAFAGNPDGSEEFVTRPDYDLLRSHLSAALTRIDDLETDAHRRSKLYNELAEERDELRSENSGMRAAVLELAPLRPFLSELERIDAKIRAEDVGYSYLKPGSKARHEHDRRRGQLAADQLSAFISLGRTVYEAQRVHPLSSAAGLERK